MSDLKHTPGPWVIDTDGVTYALIEKLNTDGSSEKFIAE